MTIAELYGTQAITEITAAILEYRGWQQIGVEAMEEGNREETRKAMAQCHAIKDKIYALYGYHAWDRVTQQC